MSYKIQVTTLPSKWPGCDALIALLAHSRQEHEEEAPQLLALLAQCFVATYLALFSYAFLACDARWLYRLVAHPLDQHAFARVFGGGARPALYTATPMGHAPPRPPPPSRPPPPGAAVKSSDPATPTTIPPNTVDKLSAAVDPAHLRARFNSRLLGPPQHSTSVDESQQQQQDSLAPPDAASRQRTVSHRDRATSQREPYEWVPPSTSILQFIAAKVRF